MSESHIPVLRDEVIDFLKPKSEGVYVDATIGLGGHSQCILEHSSPNGRLIGIDLDVHALEITKKRLQLYKERFSLVKGNFAQIHNLLLDFGISEVDGVLLDLGVSSLHLDSADRGFSFQRVGPLDMRMDVEMSTSAADIINDSPVEKLSDIFKEYGEERYAKQIAENIVFVREKIPVKTTIQLAGIVEDVYSYYKPKSRSIRSSLKKSRNIHPATRVFQALRISVNKELENLSCGLEGAVNVLKPGGVLIVISFHSLEDRIVKHHFQKCAKSCICPPKTPICICEHKKRLKIVTKRPVLPSENEIGTNPRARSAKLRVATRL